MFRLCQTGAGWPKIVDQTFLKIHTLLLGTPRNGQNPSSWVSSFSSLKLSCKYFHILWVKPLNSVQMLQSKERLNTRNFCTIFISSQVIYFCFATKKSRNSYQDLYLMVQHQKTLRLSNKLLEQNKIAFFKSLDKSANLELPKFCFCLYFPLFFFSFKVAAWENLVKLMKHT